MKNSKERRNAQKSAMRRTSKAARSKKDYPGGVWGWELAERLRLLKGDEGVRAWAERTGLSSSLVSSYLNGGRQPRTPALRQIAAATGVSLDWLLFGEGGEAPIKRGQWRSKRKLEGDLAVYVARELRGRGAQGMQDEWVDGEALLAAAADVAAIYYEMFLKTVRMEDEKAAPRAAVFTLLKAPHEKGVRRAVVEKMRKNPIQYTVPPELVGGPRFVASPAMHKHLDRLQRDFLPDGTMRREAEVALNPDWDAIEREGPLLQPEPAKGPHKRRAGN